MKERYRSGHNGFAWRAIGLLRMSDLLALQPNLNIKLYLVAPDEKQSKVRAQGNLDESSIVAAVTEIMEGGREAFQYRQSIYQAHWEGP